MARLAEGFRDDAFSYLLFLRLVPFPFFVVNLVAALAGVRLATFVAATALGIVPATFAFAFVGAGLDSIIAAQESAYRACLAAGNADCKLDFDLAAAITPQLIVALVALGVVALIPVIAKRMRARRARVRRADHGRAAHSRSLRHRCRLRRPVGRRRRRRARRAGGADREGQDGRRLPQRRLRAVEGDDRRRQARRDVPLGAPFGIKAQKPGVEFYQVNDHIHDVIAAIAPNNSKERFTGLGVRVIEGEARFTDANTVAVGDAFEIKARRFVIATGSVPAVPPIPGLDQTPYLTNETVFETRERPKHLIVIGGGAIGLELAQAFRRLGSDVTVLEAATPLASEDPECAAVVLDRLAREGVAIRSGVTITQVRRVRNRVEVDLHRRERRTATR